MYSPFTGEISRANSFQFFATPLLSQKVKMLRLAALEVSIVLTWSIPASIIALYKASKSVPATSSGIITNSAFLIWRGYIVPVLSSLLISK